MPSTQEILDTVLSTVYVPPGEVLNACNPALQWGEQKDHKVHYPQLQSELKENLGYMRPSLRKKGRKERREKGRKKQANKLYV